jgi:hypothetical protein
MATVIPTLKAEVATPTETHQNAAVAAPRPPTTGHPPPTPTTVAAVRLQVQVVVPVAARQPMEREEDRILRKEARVAILAGAAQPVAEPSGKQSRP